MSQCLSLLKAPLQPSAAVCTHSCLWPVPSAVLPCPPACQELAVTVPLLWQLAALPNIPLDLSHKCLGTSHADKATSLLLLLRCPGPPSASRCDRTQEQCFWLSRARSCPARAGAVLCQVPTTGWHLQRGNGVELADHLVSRPGASQTDGLEV